MEPIVREVVFVVRKLIVIQDIFEINLVSLNFSSTPVTLTFPMTFGMFYQHMKSS